MWEVKIQVPLHSLFYDLFVYEIQAHELFEKYLFNR